MQKHGFHPTEIIFSSTTACNLHCEHCFINRTPRKLELSDAVRLIESCVESGGQAEPDGTQLPVIDRIGFSGGEPFLALDFVCEIVQKTVEKGAYFDRLMTNAAAFEGEEMKAAIEKLFDAGFDGTFGISFDAFHAQKIETIFTL